MERLTKEQFLNKYSDICTEEQLNKLNFNWFEDHYPKNKRLPETDIKYLFLELNFTTDEIADCFGCLESRVRTTTRFYKLKKTSKQRKEILKRTCLRKYGVEHPHQLPEIREKVYKTNIERYGTYCSSKSDKVKEKAKRTCQERYGTNSTANLPQTIAKKKKTLQEKYGVDNPSNLQWVRDKIKAKFPETKKKMEKTCLEKYNSTSFSSSIYRDNDKIKEKAKQTFLKKYGVDNPMKVPEIQRKAFDTAVRNGSFNGYSKPENIIYDKLFTKFKDVKRQYRSKEYPFACDFYIPQLDLYIEYQGTWMHGFHPFNENSKEDLEVKTFMESKIKEHPSYKTAIKIWTIRDVKKRNVAKQNNLNYLEFFNMEEFDKWFKDIT